MKIISYHQLGEASSLNEQKPAQHKLSGDKYWWLSQEEKDLKTQGPLKVEPPLVYMRVVSQYCHRPLHAKGTKTEDGQTEGRKEREGGGRGSWEEWILPVASRGLWRAGLPQS